MSEILASLYADPVLAFRHLLPDWFPSKMPWFHRGILAIVLRRTDFLLNFGPESWRDGDAEWTEEDLQLIVKWFKWQKPDGSTGPIFKPRLSDGRLVAVDLEVGKYTILMIPRGFSKTTLANAVVLFKVLFNDTKFTLYVSETGPHAARQLGNVKAELESNPRILALWGQTVPDRNDPLKSNENQLETLLGPVLMSRGRGGQVRGLNHNSNRPDFVLVDDLEDMESVSTDEQRSKVKNWTMADLKPVLPRLNPNATMVFLGTLLHRDSVLMNLARDPEFTFIRFGAKLADGSFLWPANMDATGYEKERRSYALQGTLNRFYMEFDSVLRDDSTALFRPEFFSNIVRPTSREALNGVSIAIDPAISESKTADKCAIAVVGMSERGHIHLLDLVARVGMSPREQIDTYFELAIRWSATVHGVEAIAYQAALIHLLREEMFRKKRYFEPIAIRHGKQKKTERIEGILQPRFAARYITFQRDFPEITTQLLDWPNGGFDESDAFAMAVGLLDPYAAAAADPERNLAEDEYEPLGQEFYALAP